MWCSRVAIDPFNAGPNNRVMKRCHPCEKRAELFASRLRSVCPDSRFPVDRADGTLIDAGHRGSVSSPDRDTRGPRRHDLQPVNDDHSGVAVVHPHVEKSLTTRRLFRDNFRPKRFDPKFQTLSRRAFNS